MSDNTKSKATTVTPSDDAATEPNSAISKMCKQCNESLAVAEFLNEFCCSKCFLASMKAKKTESARLAKEEKAKLKEEAKKAAAGLTSLPKFDCLPVESPEVRAEKWARVEAVLHKYFHNPEIPMAKAILASIASQVLKEYPCSCWLMVTAPPGSMKTALLMALEGLPRFYFVDTMTEHTLLSGKIDNPNKTRHEPASYLHRMGSDAILISKDFGALLSLDKNKLGAVLAQLCDVFDGHFKKETGSDENAPEREWRGRLTMVAGCTADLDRHHKVFQAVGPRFVRLRAPRIAGAEAGLAAMHQKKVNNDELKRALYDFMIPIMSWAERPAPSTPEALEMRLAHLTELLCQVRSNVPRDSHHEISDFVETESNTRLPQELAQLTRGWAVLMGRTEVNEEDFALAKRAAWDSMPPVRKAVLKALILNQQPKDAIFDLPETTVQRAAEDLIAIGLAESEDVTDDDEKGESKKKKQYTYALSRAGRKLIEAIKGDTVDGMILKPTSTLETEVLKGSDVQTAEAKHARKLSAPHPTSKAEADTRKTIQ
jgi:hypothetical protein